MKGPLLLACNHPNSFLDGILLDILFEEPVWALARGDVFKKPLHIKFLKAVRLLPVYRTSEGIENLQTNYDTFTACKENFREDGIVQIFSEGKCINEWHLRPLKKGTARLAISSWEENIPLAVLPVGINYSSFRTFGKNIHINFGKPISKEDIVLGNPDGKRFQEFNDLLNGQLKGLVYEICKADISKQKEVFESRPPVFQKIIFALPAALGFLFHAPLYLPVKNFVWKKCNHNDHYDSVLAAILLFIYPFYLLLLAIILFLIFNTGYVFLIFMAFPFTAWSYVLLKKSVG